MQIKLNAEIAKQYKSSTQKARVITEAWAKSEIFCPNCGKSINSYENNRPVADFYCRYCAEEYELKSKKNSFKMKITDGAYDTMIKRMRSRNNPNLFLLSYDLENSEVSNFAVIPKYFFTPEIIEKRKPLSNTARRAGWTGCNILLRDIPRTGMIFYIRNKQVLQKDEILSEWKKSLFLKNISSIKERTWLLDIMKCIDNLHKKEFFLSEIYDFEKTLSIRHPYNRHIKDKIRQQLQFLRNKGYLDFIARGRYKII